MTDFRALCAELVDELEDWIAYGDEADCADAHAVVDRARAALSQPEPQGPTDEELLVWASYYGIDYVDISRPSELDGERAPVRSDELCIFARAALARWGRTAIEPVPVAERLPGPEDCAPWPDEPDANPWCWAGKEVDGGWEWAQIGMLGVDAKNLGRVLGGGGWTHWLSHHALPVPQQEADRD